MSYFLDLDDVRAGDSVLRDKDPVLGPGWLHYANPQRILEATSAHEVATVLGKATANAEAGGWSVGFLTYEAGAALHPELGAKEPDWPTLAWFALYDSAPVRYRELAPVYEDVAIENLEPEWTEEEYRTAFGRVKQALAEGESYQVNLTFRQNFRCEDTAIRFFSSRCGIDPPVYAAFIHGGEWQVASFSPELLFQRRGDEVVTKPMKGTALVPNDPREIPAVAAALSNDPKSIAENVMIVDMVRNDLGQIAEVGSVQTPELLKVERHRGLLQMTSTVACRTSAATDELLKAVFPAASITGAPKVATTKIITEVETSPRHIYCGSIGMMTRDWQSFNVAIRTALIRGDEGEFGVGSGVVWDSQCGAEYQECLDKRDFLLRAGTPWELVDALGAHDLRDDSKVESHLARLDGSAKALGIDLDLDDLRSRLDATPWATPESRIKVRIAATRCGKVSLSVGSSVMPKGPLRAVLASGPVASNDPNLSFKTNSRRVFDETLEEHPWFDEVLLWNEMEEITEFCRGNVLVQLGGELLTPPVGSGCLAGTTVHRLVSTGKASYARITLEMLGEAEEVYFANSVTGVLPVVISRA